MIWSGFLDGEISARPDQIARDGSAPHRLAPRANALVLLDDAMSCEAVAKVLLLDDDTIHHGTGCTRTRAWEAWQLLLRQCHLSPDRRTAGAAEALG
jgi:hypothetical protein